MWKMTICEGHPGSSDYRIPLFSDMLVTNVMYVLIPYIQKLILYWVTVHFIMSRSYHWANYKCDYYILCEFIFQCVIQVKHQCKYKIKVCQLFFIRCLQYPFNYVRMVVKVIDSVFAKQCAVPMTLLNSTSTLTLLYLY